MTDMLIDAGGGRQAVIDAADYPGVADFSWGVAGKGYVSARVRGSRSRKRAYLHRLILNAPPGAEVDHINGDPLDNRRANLRPVSRSENMRNRRGPDRDNRSGFRGVSWPGQSRRHRAQLQVDGRTIYLGLFDRLGDAARAAECGRARYMTHA